VALVFGARERFEHFGVAPGAADVLRRTATGLLDQTPTFGSSLAGVICSTLIASPSRRRNRRDNACLGSGVFERAD
jgi:hypothetical protein